MAFLMKFKSFFYSLSDVDCMHKKKIAARFALLTRRNGDLDDDYL